MHELREIANIKSDTELRAAGMGHYGDALLSLYAVLDEYKPRRSVEGLLGVLPSKLPKKPPAWIRLYSVTSIGSDYAAVRGVEELLARYYKKHGTLAFVEPLVRNQKFSFKEQYPIQYAQMLRQGVLIHAND